MKNPVAWLAKRYHDNFREHWGVFVDGHMVDVSTDEYDVELRSCSLCECSDLSVIVRHAKPYTTTQGDKRWRINSVSVLPREYLGDIGSWD
jgi:hypothetical protein